MPRTPQRERPAAAARPGPPYDAAYYAHYYTRGGPATAYERSEQWLGFFGGVADRIVAEIAPATSLDVGCAHGFLVEALRDRGVDAGGFDISEFAISQVREDVRPHVRVGSVLTPISDRYDLVTCVEVLEHLDEKDADAAVANICAVTDDVIFSSTPDDFAEPTHVNVRPSEYWSELFARHEFVRDQSFDGSFLAWWAARYRRRRDPWHRVLADYERVTSRLRSEAHQRNALVGEQRQEIDRLQARADQLESTLGETQTREADLGQRCGDLQETVDGIVHSRTYRAATAMSKVIRRIVPVRTRR
jgi:2-polyprenyl-3-methyl-5-hydroxy-6-metoxy-1,4-benzoquinol methylase